MKYLSLPDDTARNLPFYLAMEEYAARNFAGEELFFTWQVPPTVICGRHQVIAHEVDLDYCHRAGIAVYRRKSGGGAVYADGGNLMLSCVVDAHNVTDTFARYLDLVVDVLQSLGINAQHNSRNDIVVDGFKVSGNAYLNLHNRAVVHGTLLYDASPVVMAHALTPSRAKLDVHGVSSVPSRITTLRPRLSITLPQLRDELRQRLTRGEHRLTTDDMAGINDIMSTYLDPDFLADKQPRGTTHRSVHVDGVGQLEATTQVTHGVIASACLTGDYFATGDVDALTARLTGAQPEASSLQRALEGCTVSDIIPGLNNETFINLFIQTT